MAQENTDMGYRLQLDEPLADGIPGVVCEQLDRALAELKDHDNDVAEAVHQVRKRCKKIRGVLRLVRGSLSASYRQENVWFRDLARRLSGPRDAQALLEWFDQLREAFSADLEPGAFAGVRKALAERRTEVHEGGELAERVADTVEVLQAARMRVLGWCLFADEPRYFCQRLHHYWQAAQRDAARAAGLSGPGC